MPDLLRFIRILAKLTQGILDMQEELATLRAAVADQTAKLDTLIALPRTNPADIAAVAEIKAAIDANTAKIDAALAPVG